MTNAWAARSRLPWASPALLRACDAPSTLLYTPMRTDQAARDIRKEETEYISDASQRQRMGQIEDAQQSAEYNDVLQQEAGLTAGHRILRTTRTHCRQRPRPR